MFRKTRQRAKVARAEREVDPALRAHLEGFVDSRKGVEVWVEMPTNFNRTSILLVAADGEWTRRPVPSPEWGRSFAEQVGIPAYDAGVVGYPQRMRDWDRRKAMLDAQRRKTSAEPES